MKTTVFKNIFFIIVIILIALGVYLLYIDNKKENIKITDNELKIDMINEFTIGIINYDTINPILSTNRDIQYIDKLIFDSLIEITPDFKIQNSLAKEVSKVNSTTYLVKLNDNILWHNGDKFFVDDVIFTIENLIKDEMQSIYKENVKNIKEVEKIDDSTIKILLKEETPFFEYMLTFPILSANTYDTNFKSETSMPVGTGKFKIYSMEDDNIELVKSNPEDECKISKIHIIKKLNMKNLYNAFSKGEIDFIIVDNIIYEDYIGTMGYNVNSSKGRKFEYLVFNNKDEILSNKKIRQAINYAIDKKLINYNLYNNKYGICNFPLDYGSYLSKSDDEKYSYSVDKSKELLIEQGWKYNNGIWKKKNKILEFNLIVNENNEKRNECAKQLREQLKNAGIKINIVKVSDIVYNDYVKNNNYDIILTGNIISNCPNLETYFGENNLSNFQNEEVKDILNSVKNITDEELLKEKYFRLQDIYREERPFVSLYFNNITILTNPNFMGDLFHNWYNLFYNINNWYKIKK